jgi:sRNA-binding regulator protein Hfq
MVGTVSAWKKVPVRVVLHNGTVMQGVFVIARDSRLSDFLNNQKKTFIALVDKDKHTHMLNKTLIAQVSEMNI